MNFLIIIPLQLCPYLVQQCVPPYRHRFSFPWGRCSANCAKFCMDRKTLPCLQNASQHVAIYLQQFPSYLKQNCKKNYFYVPRPSFLVFPGDAPVAITQNVTWMKIQFSAFQTLCSMLPSVLNSFSVFKSASTKSRGFYVPQPIFLPVDAPAIVQLCLTTYKCLHGLAPPHLIRFCTPLSAVASRTNLSSADQHKLMFVPRTHTLTFGPRAFSSSSPLSWNALPPASWHSRLHQHLQTILENSFFQQ